MEFLELFRYFLILIVPGIMGSVAFSIAHELKSTVSVHTALSIDLLTFIIMITGLYFLHDVYTMSDMLFEFTCLSFTRNYTLLSILIAVVLGVAGGLIQRLFFRIRK